MKVLITGGAGFVGSELMSYLRYRDDIDAAVLDISTHRSHNICNEDTLKELLPVFDTIVHLAAVVGEPACSLDPELAYNINVGAVQKIVRNLSLSQRFIYASSTSVYGNRPGELVDERTVPIPNNHYARHKYEAEQIIQNSLRNYIILRPATAFGVSSQLRLDLLVNTLIYEAYTTGVIKLYEPNIIRPMIHVTDFARFIIHAIDDWVQWGEIYNIGDPSITMTKEKLALAIGNVTGALVQYVDGSSLDPRDYNVSFSKIKSKSDYTFVPFKFTKNPLELAANQIKLHLAELQQDPDKYSTVERTRNLFKEHRDVLYN